MRLKGKSICLFSSKGGTGKSTMAINLAGTFSSLGKKVLIIDFDATGGAIGAYLNKPFEKTLFNIVEDLLNNRYTEFNKYITKYNDNIDFIPSPKDPRQGARITSGYIDAILEKAVFEYDIVICDTNHYLGEFNVTLLDKVDETILVMNNDLLDLKNTRNLIHIFHDIEKTNYKLLLYEVNPNKKYYSIFDIKNIIKTNLDYVIDSSFFIKTYDNYVADGLIMTLNPKLNKLLPKVSKVFNLICKDMLKEDENEK